MGKITWLLLLLGSLIVPWSNKAHRFYRSVCDNDQVNLEESKAWIPVVPGVYTSAEGKTSLGLKSFFDYSHRQNWNIDY